MSLSKPEKGGEKVAIATLPRLSRSFRDLSVIMRKAAYIPLAAQLVQLTKIFINTRENGQGATATFATRHLSPPRTDQGANR